MTHNMPHRGVFLLKALGLVTVIVTLFYVFSQVSQGPNVLVPESNSNLFSLRSFFRATNQTVVPAEPSDALGLIFTYRDLEAKLCDEIVNFSEIAEQQVAKASSDCPKHGISTVVAGGRTGNQMWEYAAAWAVARLTKLEPYIPNCILQPLDQIFEGLTLPSFSKIAHCPVEYHAYVQTIDAWKFVNQSVILRRYVTEPRLVLPMVQDIVPEFQFRKIFRDKAQKILSGFAKKLGPKQYTYVGVHVRRTDYIAYLKRKYEIKPVQPRYFVNAMNYYRQKYRDCLFVYVSDDPKWCFQQFGKLRDVIVASYNTKNTAAEDMAIMAACNHTIFDYGTYGEWGSILAGGEVVYNNIKQNWQKAQFMDKWVKMD